MRKRLNSISEENPKLYDIANINNIAVDYGLNYLILVVHSKMNPEKKEWIVLYTDSKRFNLLCIAFCIKRKITAFSIKKIVVSVFCSSALNQCLVCWNKGF